MVDLLVRLHACEQFRLDVVVGPAEVEVEVGDRLGLQVPLVFAGDVFNDGVLGVCMGGGVPLTLMTSLFLLLANWLL